MNNSEIGNCFVSEKPGVKDYQESLGKKGVKRRVQPQDFSMALLK